MPLPSVSAGQDPNEAVERALGGKAGPDKPSISASEEWALKDVPQTETPEAWKNLRDGGGQ